jgi:hypothetical protein
MEQRGVTLHQLAFNTKIPASSLRRYISGESCPPSNRLDVLCRHLAVPARQLIYRGDNG